MMIIFHMGTVHVFHSTCIVPSCGLVMITRDFNIMLSCAQFMFHFTYEHFTRVYSPVCCMICNVCRPNDQYEFTLKMQTSLECLYLQLVNQWCEGASWYYSKHHWLSCVVIGKIHPLMYNIFVLNATIVILRTLYPLIPEVRMANMCCRGATNRDFTAGSLLGLYDVVICGHARPYQRKTKSTNITSHVPWQGCIGLQRREMHVAMTS